MKSYIHTLVSGSRRSSRRAMTGALQYMSERQTQAYLMARDVIRRIQRTSSILDSISENSVRPLRAANRRQNSH